MQFSLYFFYLSNNQLYLRWLLAVVGSPVVAGGGIVLTPTGKATKKKNMWRLFLLKLTAGTNPSRHVSKIERFYSCGEQIYKFIETMEFVYTKKRVQFPQDWLWKPLRRPFYYFGATTWRS